MGVEIPSTMPQDVGFKDMLNAYRNLPNKHHIPVLLGKTVRGEDVMCDLTKMPHCIIAGATGSGKVCMYQYDDHVYFDELYTLIR